MNNLSNGNPFSSSSATVKPLSSVNQTLNQLTLLDPRIQEIRCGFDDLDTTAGFSFLCNLTLFPQDGGKVISYKNKVKADSSAFYARLRFTLKRSIPSEAPRLTLSLTSLGVDGRAYLSKPEALKQISQILNEQANRIKQGQIPTPSSSNIQSWSEEDFK